MKTLKTKWGLVIAAGCALAVACLGCGSTILDNPGVTLPVSPPEKSDYDKEATDLNNQAMELVGKDPKKVLSLLDQAIAKDATNPLLHLNRASHLVEQKDFAEAAKSLERASELQPDSANTYIAWSYCLHRLNKPQEAERKLRFAIAAANAKLKSKPDDRSPRINRAIAVYLLGDSELAIRELDEVIHADASETIAENLRKEMREHSKEDPWKILHLID